MDNRVQQRFDRSQQAEGTALLVSRDWRYGLGTGEFIVMTSKEEVYRTALSRIAAAPDRDKSPDIDAPAEEWSQYWAAIAIWQREIARKSLRGEVA